MEHVEASHKMKSNLYDIFEEKHEKKKECIQKIKKEVGKKERA